MSNTGLKLSIGITILFLTQSALAGSFVRYLCQRNMGTTFEPQLTNEIIVVESTEPNPLPVDKFELRFLARSFDMNFRMTRYKEVNLDGFKNPYEALNHLTREQMVGESFETPRPVKTNGGDVPIYHKTEKGERAQFIIKSAMLFSVIYEVFPDGEYFLAKENQRFVCHEPDFFETKVSEEELYLDDQSADFTSY